MICEHCKEETGVGTSHYVNRKTGEWRCPSLESVDKHTPWMAVRLLEEKLTVALLQKEEYRKLLQEFADHGCAQDFGRIDNGPPRPCAMRPDIERPCFACRSKSLLEGSMEKRVEEPCKHEWLGGVMICAKCKKIETRYA